MVAVPRSRRRDDQAGFTLVELLVTVTLMGITFIIVLGAISTFSRATSVQRTASDLDGALRTYVERLNDVGYANCASTYAVAAGNLPSGYLSKYQPTVTVKYWNGDPNASYGPSCPSPDAGAQQLTVQLKSTATGQQDSLTVVKRSA